MNRCIDCNEPCGDRDLWCAGCLPGHHAISLPAPAVAAPAAAEEEEDLLEGPGVSMVAKRGGEGRACPGCGTRMRWEDVCCGQCWRKLPRGLRVEMLLERSAKAYDKLYGRALKMLGARDDGSRYMRKLPIDELESGRPDKQGAAGKGFLRYPETEELLGKFFLLVLRGYAGPAPCRANEKRREDLIEAMGREAMEKARAADAQNPRPSFGPEVLAKLT